MSTKKITIAGLGLIGGSLAKAFRRTNHDFIITGVDTSPENLRLAKKEGTVDHICNKLDESAVSDSQFVFLCTPVSRMPEMLSSLGQVVRPGTVITDVGSIKSSIMKEAEQILPETFISSEAIQWPEENVPAIPPLLPICLKTPIIF